MVNETATLYVTSKTPNPSYPGAQIIEVFCPRCWRSHIHGIPKGDTFPTDRVAHCGDFSTIGYDRYLIDEVEGYSAPPTKLKFNTSKYKAVGREVVTLSDDDLYGDGVSAGAYQCSSTLYCHDLISEYGNKDWFGCEVVKTGWGATYLAFVFFEPETNSVARKTKYMFAPREDVLRTLEALSTPSFYKNKAAKRRAEYVEMAEDMLKA